MFYQYGTSNSNLLLKVLPLALASKLSRLCVCLFSWWVVEGWRWEVQLGCHHFLPVDDSHIVPLWQSRSWIGHWRCSCVLQSNSNRDSWSCPAYFYTKPNSQVVNASKKNSWSFNPFLSGAESAASWCELMHDGDTDDDLQLVCSMQNCEKPLSWQN